MKKVILFSALSTAALTLSACELFGGTLPL